MCTLVLLRRLIESCWEGDPTTRPDFLAIERLLAEIKPPPEDPVSMGVARSLGDAAEGGGAPPDVLLFSAPITRSL